MQRISLRFSSVLVAFLPAAFVLSVAVSTVYLMGQYVLRSGANDPQIQLAEDVAAALHAGKMPEDIVPTGAPFALETSLSTFVVIVSEKNSAIAANGRLGGAMPKLPDGVLNAAKVDGKQLVTWEPKNGLRFATVTVPYVSPAGAAGFVTSGRSLREVESRIADLGWIAWSAELVGLLVLGAFFWMTKTATRSS